MSYKKSPLDEIAGEYAEALAAREFERAAGWFAVAPFVSARQEDAALAGDMESLDSVEVHRHPPAA